jgi:hypothetical protein
MTLTNRTLWLAAIVGVIAVVAVALIAGTQLGLAGGDGDEPITGEALQRASEAALAHTGGGRVTETEVGDEESYYEVEVTLDDGSQVDVQLDENFNVVSDKQDDETEDENNDADD